MAFTRLTILLKLLGMKMRPGQAPMRPMRLTTPKIARGRRGYGRKDRRWERHLIRPGFKGRLGVMTDHGLMLGEEAGV